MTLNLQATSVTRLTLYESAIVSRFVFSRKIRRPATFDFCNTIPQMQTLAVYFCGHALINVAIFNVATASDPNRPSPSPQRRNTLRQLLHSFAPQSRKKLATIEMES